MRSSRTSRPHRGSFRPGIAYSIPYNPTEYVQESVDEVATDAHRGDHPRHPRHRHFPADMAGGDNPHHRHSGVAGRHFRGAAGARILDQFAIAIRARPRRRNRCRRRHRRGRGGREAYARRHFAARCRAQDDAGNFRSAHRNRAGSRRSVRPGRADLGHSGHLLPPVRGHDRCCGGHIDDHFADSFPRACGLAAEAARHGCGD